MALLDQKDKTILEYLYKDARFTTKELARFANITQPAAYKRLKRLEKEKFISRYDAIVDYQLLPLIKKSYLCNLNEEKINKLKERKEVIVLIKNIGQFSHHLFCWFKNITQQKKFERLLPKDRKDFIIKNLYTENAIIFDIPIQVKIKEYKKNILKLTNEDIKILKVFCEGGVKKTLKELSDLTGLSIDIIHYRKKRLIKNGYFSYFVAQPGYGPLNLNFSYIYIKTKNLKFPKNSRIAILAELDYGVLLGFFSKDINDFNNVIDNISEFYRDCCEEQILITNKNPIILNRYPFEFLL